ncbi:peptidoglycan DD-metalloendopeptidase family protein [Flavobacteriaceae bacterium]|nr:peptidoglycan DD-metalloendopeptidase family protein [Flavobacteriaceae bacterium]MDC0097192.1 peptidoglycan DD-metalloendopeptidase family protein [Flavobacteriaceae bacterium]
MKKRFYILVFSVLFFGNFSALAQPGNKQQQLEQQRESILNDIKKINTLLFKTRGVKKTVLSEVEDINQRIKAQQNLIRVTNQQANLLTRKINENLTQISLLRNELQQLKEDYAAMVQKSYKSKSQQSRVLFLLSSEDFLQAYKRVQYMKQYANHRKKQGESIKTKTELLQQLNLDLIDQRKEKDLLISENTATKAKLKKEKELQQTLITSLKKEESTFTKQIRAKQQKANKINGQIKKLIRDAIAAANKKARENKSKTTIASATKFALTPEAAAIAKDFKNNKGKLIWPVKQGLVINKYGTRQHPQFPNVTQTFHGVEIATNTNAQARAVFNGEILQIQQLKNANKAVMIQHGDYITIYYNLATISVKKGDKVSTKDPIGKVFTHPVTKQTVIKFMVYRNDTEMNPADWVYKM